MPFELYIFEVFKVVAIEISILSFILSLSAFLLIQKDDQHGFSCICMYCDKECAVKDHNQHDDHNS